MAINALSAGEGGTPQVIVGDASIEGSQTPGGGTRSLTLDTDGSVRVEGTINYINAAPTDSLLISAGQRIEVITPGGIQMTNSTGALSGMLTLQSDNIVVTDSALAARLAADPTFAGFEDALKTNNGATNPAGYLQAGGIALLGGSNIFIQNTGTATDFAGLTVGGGGLLVGRYQTVVNANGTQGFSFVGT